MRKSALAVYLYLILLNDNLGKFCDFFDCDFSGKIVVNQEPGLKGLQFEQVKGILQVLKKLEIKKEEQNKIWFINIFKIFKE